MSRSLGPVFLMTSASPRGEGLPRPYSVIKCPVDALERGGPGLIPLASNTAPADNPTLDVQGQIMNILRRGVIHCLYLNLISLVGRVSLYVHAAHRSRDC